MHVTVAAPYALKFYDFTHKETILHEVFEIAKTVGFDGIDYLATIPDAFFTPEKVVELSVQYDMPVLCLHAPLHLLLWTPELLMKKTVQTIKYFPQVEVINYHLSGFFHPLDPNGKSLKKFMDVVKKEKAPVSFESNPIMLGLDKYPKVTYDPDIFAQYCIQHKLPITFDTSHIADCNYDIVKFFNKYHKYIKLIHLSDAKGKEQHLPLGKGNLPIVELLKQIKKVSYNQHITFEICNFPINATTKEKMKDIAQSLAMVNRYAR